MKVVVVIMALLLAPAALAQPPSGIEEAAERLHQQATDAYRRGEAREAIGLWREAITLTPNWKYAYNLANTLYETGQPRAAWDYAVQARELGLPVRYTDLLGQLRARIAGALAEDHVWIQLKVTPEGASVTRDGQPWVPPWGTWVQTERSQIEVSRDGFKSQRFTWEHGRPIERHERFVRLKPLSRGTLLITGEPAGALVRVNGTDIGRLPQAGPVELEPGPHRVEVSHDGYKPENFSLTVSAGSAASSYVDLDPKAPRLAAAPVDLGVPGWATLGAGVALAATGGGLLGWSESIAAEVNEINADRAGLAGLGPLTPAYEAYRAQVAPDIERYEAARIAGWVLTGVGVAAVATGTILLVLDAQRDDAPEVGVSLAPGGGALYGRVRF